MNAETKCAPPTKPPRYTPPLSRPASFAGCPLVVDERMPRNVLGLLSVVKRGTKYTLQIQAERIA